MDGRCIPQSRQASFTDGETPLTDLRPRFGIDGNWSTLSLKVGTPGMRRRHPFRPYAYDAIQADIFLPDSRAAACATGDIGRRLYVGLRCDYERLRAFQCLL